MESIDNYLILIQIICLGVAGLLIPIIAILTVIVENQKLRGKK
tara:strand:- start:1882 stop:2010 length:129 start_codon:yes stop_codon:yes gene_type:complete